jgi:hypothetical protein
MHADVFADSDSDGALFSDDGLSPPLSPRTVPAAPVPTPAPSAAPIASHQSAMAFDDDEEGAALAAFSDDE